MWRSWLRCGAVSLVVFGAAACDSTEKPKTIAQPTEALDADRCDEPAALKVTGITQVIGDGTRASCNAASVIQALANGGHISFNCGDEPVTIEVTETLMVRDNTVIDGAGRIVLDGADQIRIMRTENQANVVLAGLTFQHGSSPRIEGDSEANGSGGAILRGYQSNLFVRDCNFIANRADPKKGAGGAIATASSGHMTLLRCSFTENSGAYGGAVYSVLSDLIIVDSKFSSNSALASDGGAIFTDGAYTKPKAIHGAEGGLISICGSRFTNNRAVSSAAAGFLFAYGLDQLTINRSEFRENAVSTADPGLGGALRIDAEASVQNSLFVENNTAGQGGAIWMGRGPARFENVTFYGNHAALWGGAISYGDKPISLKHCTLARNIALKGADGLFGNAGTAAANNTLFVENGAASSVKRHCSAKLDGTHNLAFPVEENDACGADWLHVDPQIADALEDLGGATQTLAIGSNGGAVDAAVNCSATDQRGKSRDPARCDLGAFELTSAK